MDFESHPKITKVSSNNFKLTDDIELSESHSTIEEFTGSLNGDGYTISNISRTFIKKLKGKIENISFKDCCIPGSERLFGVIRVNDGVIRDTTVEGFFEGRSRKTKGALVQTNNGLITNCTVDAQIISASNCGVIVGKNSDEGIVKECSSSGQVSGEHKIGGLVGVCEGKLTNCTSDAQIRGLSYVGGLVGMLKSNLTNCSFTGSVSGTGISGGLVGSVKTVEFLSVQNCTVDTVVSGCKSVGGLIGNISIEGDVKLQNNHLTNGKLQNKGAEDQTSVFCNIQNAGSVVITECSATLEVLSEKIQLFNWVTDVDDVTAEYTYTSIEIESLKEQPIVASELASSKNFIEIKHTTPSISTQKVSSEYELQESGKYDTIILEDDIYLNTSNFFTEFNGTLQGNNHTIYNLNQVLFPILYSDAVIKNLNILNGSVERSDNVPIYVTGLLSNYNNGKIQNISVKFCSVRSENNYYIGSIAGISTGTIENITQESVQIQGGEYNGILCGIVRNKGTVVDCDIEDSEVLTKKKTGGLIGVNKGEVHDCSITDSRIDGETEVGGLVAQNYNSIKNSVVHNCTVNGTYYVGGFVSVTSDGVIQNCEVHETTVTSNTGGSGFSQSIYADSIIRNCYSEAKVNGKRKISGFSSEVQNSKIVNCVAEGVVSSSHENLSGFITKSSLSIIKNSYCKTKVIGSESGCGFIHSISGGEVKNCFTLSVIDTPEEQTVITKTDRSPDVLDVYWSTKLLDSSEYGTGLDAIKLQEFKTLVLL